MKYAVDDFKSFFQHAMRSNDDDCSRLLVDNRHLLTDGDRVALSVLRNGQTDRKNIKGVAVTVNLLSCLNPDQIELLLSNLQQ